MKSILNNYIKKIDTRKFWGTIIGGIFFICCILFFTYAYYEWKSENTSIALQINDLSTKCMPGADVNVSNIGPVLNYEDGVISEFSIENGTSKEMAIDLRLNITSISDNLLVKSFKYAVVTNTTGGTNYDYANPILEGTFENFKVGSNVITTALAITPSITQSFQFIVYIDGNMKNDINMQSNNLVANLMIGNCEENATSMDELVYQAIYSETDNSLTFIYNKPVTVGETYNNKAVTAVYTDFEDTTYSSASVVPWYADGNYANITSVEFEEKVAPTSTAYWFNGFSNLTSINLEKLDTSKVTSMLHMFSNCSSLTSLDLSKFDTSNVIIMSYMFKGCSNLTSLDVSNFNTSSVTKMVAMFYGCSSLNALNLSNFNTSKVTNMNAEGYPTNGMFENCYNLTYLDISSFDTSNVTGLSGMFANCYNLISLDVSNFDTSNVRLMNNVFANCKSLTELDVSNFDTSKVTNITSMFTDCSSLIELDLRNFDTSKARYAQGMFYNCSSLSVLLLGNFNFNSVTDQAGLRTMFYKCSSLTELDVSGWNTSGITNMAYMFYGCSGLTSLDISSFDTSSVTNMDHMFRKASSLKELTLGEFDTSSIKTTYYMFDETRNVITEIIIKSTNVEDYRNMFSTSAIYNGASIKVYYVGDNPDTTDVNESTKTLVDNMVATKTPNANIVNAGCKGDHCPVEETTEEETTE